jgi:hypothetical protein
MLPGYLEDVLRSRGVTVRLVPCQCRPDFYDLYEGERSDESAVALVEIRPSESATPSFYLLGDYRVGPYHFVGNAALVMRVCQALPKGEEHP